MSAVYNPNPANNPLSYTMPADGDPDSALTFTVPLTALADKAAYIGTFAGQLPALNWGVLSTLGNAPVNIVWSDFQQRWFAPLSATGTATIYYSVDFGKTWTSASMGSSITALDAAVDATGNVVVVAASGTGQVGTAGATYGSALTWTSVAMSAAITAGSIAYDANGLGNQWFGVGASSGGAISAFQSSNRTTWNGPTLPTTWSATANGKSVVVGTSGTGTAVFAFIDSTTTFRTLVRNPTTGAYGNDAQHTVDPAVGTMTLNVQTEPRLISRPVWSVVDSLWYLAVNGNTGSQIWSSPDGITWTSVRVFSPNQAYSLVVIGALMVALDVNGMVLVSVNKGVNWYRCGDVSSTTVTAVRAGGGGLLAFNSAQSVSSMRYGVATAVT